MSEFIVQAVNLNKDYTSDVGMVHVLRNINIGIRAGEMVSIVGPSGSGKSTLLGILGTLDVPSSGELYIDGHQVSSLPENQLADFRAKKIGFVFQSYNLISTMTAKENILISLKTNSSIKKGLMEKRALDLLDAVGLKDKANNLPSQLSGGQQQRVAIARALANAPSIVVADEPTGNLDSSTGNSIIDLILQLKSNFNTTFIIATHDPKVAASSSRILNIIDGRIEERVGVHS